MKTKKLKKIYRAGNKNWTHIKDAGNLSLAKFLVWKRQMKWFGNVQRIEA